MDAYMGELVEHLREMSFSVIAAGKHGVDGITKIYAFASGWPINACTQKEEKPTDIQPVFGLIEIKISDNNPGKSNHINNVNSDLPWNFECVCKCTETDRAPEFIKELNLGNIFQVV